MDTRHEMKESLSELRKSMFQTPWRAEVNNCMNGYTAIYSCCTTQAREALFPVDWQGKTVDNILVSHLLHNHNRGSLSLRVSVSDWVYMLEHNRGMNVSNKDWIHVNRFIRSACIIIDLLI